MWFYSLWAPGVSRTTGVSIARTVTTGSAPTTKPFFDEGTDFFRRVVVRLDRLLGFRLVERLLLVDLGLDKGVLALRVLPLLGLCARRVVAR